VTCHDPLDLVASNLTRQSFGFGCGLRAKLTMVISETTDG
jgi:hypothetical protein